MCITNIVLFRTVKITQISPFHSYACHVVQLATNTKTSVTSCLLNDYRKHGRKKLAYYDEKRDTKTIDIHKQKEKKCYLHGVKNGDNIPMHQHRN